MILMIIACIPILKPDCKFKILLEYFEFKKIRLIILDSGENFEFFNLENHIYKRVPLFSHSATRNLALEYESDFYLFLTEDVTPYDDFIDNLIKPFEDKDVVVSYARQIPYPSAHPIEKYNRSVNYPDVDIIKDKESIAKMGIKAFFCSNSCAMYRSDYFRKVGGFNESCKTNEDMEFAYRAIMDGKKVAYVSNALVYHSHDISTRKLFMRYLSIGKFFKNHRYILEETSKHNKIEKEGFDHFMRELRTIQSKYGLFYAFQSIWYSGVKYFGYKLGYSL